MEIIDADLSSYFDTLPHSELLKSVARRVVDGAMLHQIKMWLEAPFEETDERGNKRQARAIGHPQRRLRQWLCAKHKEQWPATKKFPEASKPTRTT
jgi:hypothetical protein